MDFELEPTLNSIIKHTSLKWIFVGGKGGVGKTTTSSSVAVQLALNNPNHEYLLISTDPAHNLSDAFCQKFGKDARKVEGLENLSCMEIDPKASIDEFTEKSQFNNDNDPMKGIMGDVTGSIPGIDEALSFMEVLKHIETEDNKSDLSESEGGTKKYKTIIFDTAPTGHTLRFLQLPSTIEKLLSKLNDLSSKFGPMLNTMMGGNQQQEMFAKLADIQKKVTELNQQFQDPELTTFIAVCISEFLSLYETERLIQELMSYNMDVNSIVINQLLFPTSTGNDDSCNNCKRCESRWKMQLKYLSQMNELYEDYHLVKMPLLGCEIRGLNNLKQFSRFLTKAYDPKVDGALVFEIEEK